MAPIREERRKAPRRHAEVSIEFRHLGRPGESFADLSRDISAGGLFVDTTVGLPLGTELALSIFAGKGRSPIQLRAVVVRIEEQPGQTGSKSTSRTHGMALRFLQDSDRQDDEIQRLVTLVSHLERAKDNADSKQRSKK